jgi:hypothetical protein
MLTEKEAEICISARFNLFSMFFVLSLSLMVAAAVHADHSSPTRTLPSFLPSFLPLFYAFLFRVLTFFCAFTRLPSPPSFVFWVDLFSTLAHAHFSLSLSLSVSFKRREKVPPLLLDEAPSHKFSHCEKR